MKTLGTMETNKTGSRGRRGKEGGGGACSREATGADGRSEGEMRARKRPEKERQIKPTSAQLTVSSSRNKLSPSERHPSVIARQLAAPRRLYVCVVVVGGRWGWRLKHLVFLSSLVFHILFSIYHWSASNGSVPIKESPWLL